MCAVCFACCVQGAVLELLTTRRASPVTGASTTAARTEGCKGRLVQTHGGDAGRKTAVEVPLRVTERKRCVHALLQVADGISNHRTGAAGSLRAMLNHAHAENRACTGTPRAVCLHIGAPICTHLPAVHTHGTTNKWPSTGRHRVHAQMNDRW
jgi:hypothetical protein